MQEPALACAPRHFERVKGGPHIGKVLPAAAARACKDAISSNSIPAFSLGNAVAELLHLAILPNILPARR
jgi:hypothetical protein